MTLKKVEMLTGDPFLRPFEAEDSKATIIEYRTMDTQYGNDQNVLDVKLLSVPDKTKYQDEGTNKEDLEKRLDSSKRTWFINGTSFNHLVETLGEDEEKIKGQEIEFQVEDQMVKGKKKKVIYLKGSV